MNSKKKDSIFITRTVPMRPETYKQVVQLQSDRLSKTGKKPKLNEIYDEIFQFYFNSKKSK